MPAGATTTRVNIASDGSASTTAIDNNSDIGAVKAVASSQEVSGDIDVKLVEDGAKEQKAGPNADPSSLQAGPVEGSEQPGGWFSWIYGSSDTTQGTVGSLNPSETAEPQPAEQKVDQVAQPAATEATLEATEVPEPEQTRDTLEIAPATHKRSWFQMWYGSNTPSNREEQSSTTSTALPTVNDSTAENLDSDMAPKAPPEIEIPKEPKDGSQAPVAYPWSSGWSFWSRDANKDAPSNTMEEGATIKTSTGQNVLSKTTTLEPDTDTSVKIKHQDSIKIKPTKSIPLTDESQTVVDTPPVEPRPADVTATKQLQKILPNQVLPNFHETYALEESPSILHSLGRFLHYGKGQGVRHVSRVKEPLHVKRALAIGVHGYFPVPFIRSVLGQPTGTSIRFSNMAAEAIRKYTESHGYSCEIEKIALEGEGRITERVDLLWKLLLNWMEEIRKADFVMIACHSQGVPVGIMLVAKLIQFGCLDAKRIGICAMAGVNLGPFPDYRSRWISGSAGELFEFALPSSNVSREYESALECALDFGVRISYIGSIDDQLVSLEVCVSLPMKMASNC